MGLQETICRIEESLKARDVSVAQACKAAGINRATWTRWKSGATTPNMATWEKALTAVEALVEPAAS